MKTSVEIDESKVKLAKRLGEVETLRELIDLALDSFIAQQRRRSMASILGKGMISGDLDAMRERKHGRTSR